MLVDTFKPFWVISGGSVQSVAGVFWPQIKVPTGETQRSLVSIGEDGHLSVIENRPLNWSDGQRVVLLVHGLTGSENSTHPVRLADAFVRRGVLAVRMNMRGCGPGEGLSRGIYHSGRSEDTRAVLEWVAKKYPGSPITQIGISLGGNATLKMAGEFGRDIPSYLESVVAVSAPVDLTACSRRISQVKNRLFDFYFSRHLLRHVQRQNAMNPDKMPSVTPELLTGRISLAKFDDLYVAPASGFRSGQHYYDSCSSLPLIDSIGCRTLLLTSEDDPIIPVDGYLGFARHPKMNVIITKGGGHAAFISQQRDPDFGRFWMDRLIVDWVLGSKS